MTFCVADYTRTIIQTRLSHRAQAIHARSPLRSYMEYACVCGILPAAMSGRMIFQSAASHPTRRTLREDIIRLRRIPAIAEEADFR